MSHRYAALLLTCLASCSRAPAPPEARALATQTRAPPASGSSLGAERDGNAPPALDADGCAADFVGSANVEASLTQLARACATGMRRIVSERPDAALRAGEPGEFDFEVRDATRCVRGLATFAPSLRGLELELLDAAGRSYARVARDRSFALLGTRGPVCLPAAGRYRVTARARDGAGPVAVELYQAE